MPPAISPTEALRIAGEEKMRRVAAWRSTISAAAPDRQAALLERAVADEHIWTEIEYMARRVGGAHEGGSGYPSSATRCLDSITETLEAARKRCAAGKLPERKFTELACLRAWFQRHRPWTATDGRTCATPSLAA